VGYNVSSSSIYPSIRFTGRAVSDPLNSLGSETTIVAGAAAQTAATRWGDYGSMSVDPSDDCTFWYTQEYIKSKGFFLFGFNWSTRLASFRFSTCS